jgi:hypothetical protein
MIEMTEIQLVCQKVFKILVPQQLIEELGKVVIKEKFSETITEALTQELKKLRFRKDLEKARSKAV